MTWCCHITKNDFGERLSYGEFVVAGYDPQCGKVLFLRGFNLCHRKDYSAVIQAARIASQALEREGISNFKFSGFRCTRFCDGCGVELRLHYGDDGGLLRDDEYVRELLATSGWSSPATPRVE